ncbi:unnamed protein product [Sphagnum balticum]
MAFGRGLGSPLLTINFILYVIAACLAGWALNRNIDASLGSGAESAVGNSAVKIYFLPIALIASVGGIASTFAGSHLVRVWRTDTLSAAASASLIAWLLTILPMGLACKEIHVGGGFRPKRLKVLEAIIIILAFLELLYHLTLHAGVLGANYGPTYA